MYRIIFEHHPKLGQEQDFIDAWQKGSDIIQTYPGARGTKLFRNIEDPTVLFAIAEWESEAARDTAMNEMEQRPDAEDVLRAHEKFIDEVIVTRLNLIAESNPPPEGHRGKERR